jgi:hypothetical protein
VSAEPLNRYRSDREANHLRVHLGHLVSNQEMEVVVKLGFAKGTEAHERCAEFTVRDPADAVTAVPAELRWTYADHEANDAQPRDRRLLAIAEQLETEAEEYGARMPSALEMKQAVFENYVAASSRARERQSEAKRPVGVGPPGVGPGGRGNSLRAGISRALQADLKPLMPRAAALRSIRKTEPEDVARVCPRRSYVRSGLHRSRASERRLPLR